MTDKAVISHAGEEVSLVDGDFDITHPPCQTCEEDCPYSPVPHCFICLEPIR
jgi:hypothetical protein